MSIDRSEQVLDYPFRAPGALEPPEEWAKLRGGCPVAHVRLPSGDQALLLTRYADVRQVLSDPRFTRQLNKEGAARVSTDETIFENEAAASLTDDHERWRRPLAKSFTARRVSALQPKIEAMAEQLVDEMTKQGPPADLLASFGFPLPVWVICELLGIPGVDRDKLAYWSNTMLSMTQYTREQIAAAQAEFGQHFMAHIAAKRAQPGEDLLSELIAVVDEGHALSELELMTSRRSSAPRRWTCAARRTHTSRSAPGRTRASARPWRAPSCRRCSMYCCAGCRRSSSPSRPTRWPAARAW